MERKKNLLPKNSAWVLICLLGIAGHLAAQTQTSVSCAKWINVEFGNGGAVAWNNLQGAQCDADEARAFSGTAFGAHYSQSLVFTNFGHNLPAGALVQGIEVTLVRRSLNGSSVYDRTLQLTKGNGLVGTNHKEGAVWDKEWAGVTYGGPNDLWGAKWTAAEINATSFGLVFDGLIQGPEDRIEVDQALVTVYFQPTAIAQRHPAPSSKYVCAPFSPNP
jgi:hypothetical protein